MAKRTPLYAMHEKLHARFTEFGGWDMPVFYTSIIEEHNAVRRKAGLFDTSHMGQIIVSGPNSTAFLNTVVTSDVSVLVPGQAKYTLFLNPKGGIVDDLIVYRRGHDFLLVVNASNLEKDYAWLKKNQTDGVKLENISEHICLLALQGPDSLKLLQPLVKEDLGELEYFHFMTVIFNTTESDFSLVARTGYTGEDGFEIFVSPSAAAHIWEKIIEAGAVPCGLGCRDTLRLEAGMPLHGHDISDDTTPLEAGLGWTIMWDKDFIGKDVLLEQKCGGQANFLAAFVLDAAGIPRQHCDIMVNGRRIGSVTSGTFSPTLKKGIAVGYVSQKLEIGTKADIVIHGQPRPATVVKKPFYKRQK